MSDILETIDTVKFNELAKQQKIFKISEYIEPYHKTNSEDHASSHKAEFFYTNMNIYTNVKTAKTGDVSNDKFKLNIIKSLNLQTDPQNPDACTVHFSYSENGVENFESFYNMDIKSAEKFFEMLEKSKLNIGIRKDRQIIRKPKISIDMSAYGETPTTPIKSKTQTQQRTSHPQPTFRPSNASPQRTASATKSRVYNPDSLFLTEEEKKRLRVANYYSPDVRKFDAPYSNQRGYGFHSPNNVHSQAEENLPPLTSREREASTEDILNENKKKKKAPLHKRIASAFKNREKKEKKPYNLWKNGLKDITNYTIKMGCAGVVVMAVIGVFAPVVAPFVAIAGLIGIVGSGNIIEFGENTVKSISKSIKETKEAYQEKKHQQYDRYAGSEFDKKAHRIHQEDLDYARGMRLNTEQKANRNRHYYEEKQLRSSARRPSSSRVEESINIETQQGDIPGGNNPIITEKDLNRGEARTPDVLNSNNGNNVSTTQGRVSYGVGKNGMRTLEGIEPKSQDKLADTGLFIHYGDIEDQKKTNAFESFLNAGSSSPRHSVAGTKARQPQKDKKTEATKGMGE